MPTAAEFQALHDELRQLGAVFVQAANLGDQELALWGSGLEPLRESALARWLTGEPRAARLSIRGLPPVGRPVIHGAALDLALALPAGADTYPSA
jgi:hypothetical protein